MPELSVFTKLRTIPIKIEGEVLNVTFDPSAFNQEWQESLEGIGVRQKEGEEDSRDLNDEFLALMCGVIRGWDLLRDGQPVPITVGEMRGLPMALRNDVFAAVIERLQSMRPKDRRRKVSGAT